MSCSSHADNVFNLQSIMSAFSSRAVKSESTSGRETSGLNAFLHGTMSLVYLQHIMSADDLKLSLG